MNTFIQASRPQRDQFDVKVYIKINNNDDDTAVEELTVVETLRTTQYCDYLSNYS